MRFYAPLFFPSIPFNIVLLCLVGFVGCLDIVPFPHNSDVTLQVTFQPSSEILGVRKDGPFVVELVLWKPEDKTVIYWKKYRVQNIGI